MKNKLRIISIIAVMFAITIGLTSSCFASSIEVASVTYNKNGGIDFVFNGTTYHGDFTSSIYSNDKVFRNYCFVYNGKVGFLAFCDADFSYINEDGYYYIRAVNMDLSNDNYVGVYFLFVNGTGFEEMSLQNGGYRVRVDGIESVVLSSCDILNSDGEVVFQKTPVSAQNQAILVPIVQEAPLEETTKEIMGILPIVLIILVGLIGLRKGLALLSQTLHKA